ncbi:methyltransferase domain-containing protein [Acinetobacter baumannii]|uniref:Methyltransferase domain-containing protein n=1 Tax=Acinetobacter baumannii TaxID=470 RepID=A0A9P2QEV6_ACIBA|nr:methyltransferase domain-containing protein [Acinetobacter baumannii]AHB90009.1 23S ribosomal RNA G745 methyltransferase [Acinetobacter baumannii ZW85-1]EHU1440046.1 methyltransferase domain-containing protein [Acinetobacter baumannii]EHU1614766.1 methyltransferase domain-containing protein [Acinetobacter baumannii]EHU1807883.1 methyltransferase domain-containing protein [Acinetobacter baumannii]EHU2311793.1 methyltransferase domain-containing protein [Acinetobacter baumannii]
MTTQNLMCPVCRQRLELVSKTWRCEQGHSYDIAKQGYVNLHVVQHKHSKNPGDTPESVDARRAFLQGGYYQPLQQAVVHLLKQLKAKMVLDIGCGEGYYTSAMQQVVEQCIGVDIAKNAVQRAAKLNDKVTWVVGTGATLPVVNQSMDVCTSLFSPIPQTEILRVLKDDGYLIVVTPATDHLYAMREALFEQVNPHTPQKFVEQLQDLFELKEQQVIDAPLVLDQEALKNLIAMTPYAYKASPERRMQLEQKAHLQVTASFQIYLFQKRNKKAI